MKKKIVMSLLAGAAMFSLSMAQAAVVNITATFDATQLMWNFPNLATLRLPAPVCCPACTRLAARCAD